MEALAAEEGYQVTLYMETKSGEGYRKLAEYWDGCLLDAGILWTTQGSTRYCGDLGIPRTTQIKWRQRCKGCWRVRTGGMKGLTKCRTVRGERSYQETANDSIGH